MKLDLLNMGSCFKDKQAGSFGRIAILSFNGNKILNTSGESARNFVTMQVVQAAGGVGELGTRLHFFGIQGVDTVIRYQRMASAPYF